MTGHVSALWRYPIKSHSRERLDRVTLTAGQSFPWDRVWGVVHADSGADGSEWMPCVNFSRGAKAPRLAAISAALDEATGVITLSHPDLTDLTVNPDQDPAALLAWAGPLIPKTRTQSARVVRTAGVGFTDSPIPSTSIMNMASHRAVEGHLGQPLEPERWRGNVWLDGLAPWEEFDWLDREVRIGTAVLAIRERIMRCAQTAASPRTGQRDIDTPGLLQDGWGHQDFGINAEVIESGDIAVGDAAGLA